MRNFFLTLFFIPFSILADEVVVVHDPYQLYADVCNGMGCVSNNYDNCKFVIDDRLRVIVLKEENFLCLKTFQIRKSGIVISFCSEKIDSLCEKKHSTSFAKSYVCQNKEARLPEWSFLKKDKESQTILFEMALEGNFVVKKGGVLNKKVYYARKYHLYCEHGGQGGEMIFLDENNWLLFRDNYTIWY